MDDSLIIGTRYFLQEKDCESNTFFSTPRLPLQPKVAFFNGAELSVNGVEIVSMKMKKKITKPEAPRTEERLKSQQAPALYLGVNGTTRICAAVYSITRGAPSHARCSF